jgi:hypothetical protein
MTAGSSPRTLPPQPPEALTVTVLTNSLPSFDSATTCTGESDSKRILVDISALPLCGLKWNTAVKGTGLASTSTVTDLM